MWVMEINILKQKFGRLLVIEKSRRNNRASWLCQCECGNQTNVLTSNLTSGKSKSCGSCLMQTRLQHPHEYQVWSSMKSRCDNKNHQFYHHYGQRGISYQSDWKEFSNFLRDMGLKPKNKSLDRIDNNGNYSKSNCRWATEIEQKNNMRTNRLLTHNGKTQTMAEWAREIGINYRTLKSRLNIRKWPLEKALTK